MKENVERLRDNDIRVRATDLEYALIKANFQASDKNSLNDYMIESAINGYVLNVDFSQLKSLCWEINKIGNNINQIAHKVNSADIVYQTDIDELKDNVEQVTKMVREQFYKIPGIREW